MVEMGQPSTLHSYLLTALCNLLRLRHDSLLHLTSKKDKGKENRGKCGMYILEVIKIRKSNSKKPPQ